MDIKNWTAKRAGGRITIDGVDADGGGPVKLTGIDKIEPSMVPGKIVAFAKDKNGELHGLLTAAV